MNDTLKFSVDSALLTELGERLVGQPHIALGELVKNAYDADAHRVEITLEPELNRIVVGDNGHGMTAVEFQNFWMRIGSPHKVKQGTSRDIGRPMTGSKGVGRLAVQFLARHITLITVSKDNTSVEFRASVDWDKAVNTGLLTEAEAKVEEQPRSALFPDESLHGTKIILEDLNQDWNREQLEGLAKEIWRLQPPFDTESDNDRNRFVIDFRHPDPKEEKRVRFLLSAIRDIWHARLRGRLKRRGEHSYLDLVLDFADGKSIRYEIQNIADHLRAARFDIRIYHLRYRQPYGIKVDEAREYLNTFGGVGLFDAGFRLPYYGPAQDWLGTEIDHAHRIHRSKLLPEELQTSRGLQFLPTNSRLLGEVHIDTSREREAATPADRKSGDYLMIQVSRDRLVHNRAYKELRDMVRWAVDFYATQEAIRQAAQKASQAAKDEPATTKLRRVGEVLEEYRDAIPAQVRDELSVRLEEAVVASETEAETTVRRLNAMATLATAGISALAYEHEINRQFQALERLARGLDSVAERHPHVAELARETRDWMDKARASRALFAPFMDSENREERRRFKAGRLVREVKLQLGPLLRGVPVDTGGIDPEFRLPTGTFAEWSGVFQNVLLNAVNALADAEERRIALFVGRRGSRRYLRIEDTGVGVNLEHAERLFEPFQRELDISVERRGLGLGGTGLGLTIVRMLASNLGCAVAFAPPSAGYSTAFELTWRDS